MWELLYTFSYTGAAQSQLLPAGTYLFKLWGAQGGPGYYSSVRGIGGKGGYAEGEITLAAPTTVYLYVGGTGGPTGLTAGWNGGGAGTQYAPRGGGGGGGTDVRIGGQALTDRVLVAGGGGGGNGQFAGKVTGVGGGLSGTDGEYTTGGTQTAGGTGGASFGQGGNSTYRAGSGGGGGWYGGGGHKGGDTTGSGGGGSSYIGGELEVEGHTFPKIAIVNGSTTQGVREGDGLIEVWSVDAGPVAVARRVAVFI